MSKMNQEELNLNFPRAYVSWTNNEDEQLLQFWNSSQKNLIALRSIAFSHGRSVSAIHTRLQKTHHLLTSDSRPDNIIFQLNHYRPTNMDKKEIQFYIEQIHMLTKNILEKLNKL